MRGLHLATVTLVSSVLGCASPSPPAGGSNAPPVETVPAAAPIATPPPEPGGPNGAQPDGAYAPCAGKACGESCTVCSPSASDCMETAVVKQCNAQGECSPNPAACPK